MTLFIITPFNQDERTSVSELSVSEPVDENKADEENTTTNEINSSGAISDEPRRDVPPLLLPGVHNTIEDVLNGITTVEQVNKLHAEKKDTQTNEEAMVNENPEHNVSDSEFMPNSEVNLEVNSEVNSEVNLEVNLEVNVDTKNPLNTNNFDVFNHVNSIDINHQINPEINPNINPENSADVDTDEAEYNLLDVTDPDYVQAPLKV